MRTVKWTKTNKKLILAVPNGAKKPSAQNSRSVRMRKLPLQLSSEPQLASVRLFYSSNTLFTNITKPSKIAFNRREKWLVLPTSCATQCPTLKIKTQNSVLLEQ